MSMPEPGAALGASYRLAEHIGAGAAGDVWRAESVVDGTSFAAKILKAEHANDPALVERFIRERSVLIGLRHTNIVTVQDLVVEGTTLAIVMDYVSGGSLRDLLAELGPLPAGEALLLCAQVFDALAEAHGQQVTHRDIKPDNVLLTERWGPGQRETVRVTDFGIASVVSERKRETTGLLGTPQYMAPELISHGQTTPAADVYSAGVMLYELLCGRTPFAGPGTDFTVAYRHVTSRPPRLDLPEPLWGFVERLLSKDPGARLSAADAVAECRRLAARFADLQALEAAPASEEFEEIERPATMLRSDLLREADTLPEYVSPLAADAPELGEAGQRTMLRSMPKRQPPVLPVAAETEASAAKPSNWLTRKNVLLGSAGLVLVAALGVGAVWIFAGDPAETGATAAASDSLQVSQQDSPLPTGLSVSRTASFDPQTEQISLEITYSAQKAPLTGALLEIVPSTGSGSACPAVSWEGATATKHQASSTGLRANCGWKLEGVEVPANGRASISASFPGTVADAAELTEWLGGAASATADALNNQETSSTAYPVQRLRDIYVATPSRTVSQTPLPVTLVPVWPSGSDELNPLYQSPSAGAPSQMLIDIAGGEDGIRFSDGCSGAVAISSDGLVATALSVTSECRLYATVGNFTNLQSSPFSITTRE